MKATQLLSISIVLTVSAAQSFQSLPDCGKLCVNNMLAKASELGCAAGDAACLCRNVDFAYGIRDCSTDVCGPQQVASVISYGESYCKNAGSGNTGSGGVNTSMPGPVVSPTSSSILPATTLTSMTGEGSAIATSALISLVTYGTEVSTSTFSLTTIYGTETASSPTQTHSEPSMATSDTESSPTSTSEPSSSSTGSGTKPTAIAGFAAFAGLAAMIL